VLVLALIIVIFRYYDNILTLKVRVFHTSVCGCSKNIVSSMGSGFMGGFSHTHWACI